MEFRFYITPEAVNDMDVVDYEAFERAQDGEFRVYRLRPAIARFMVDENNVPVPYSIALKNSEHLKIREFNSFVGKFFDVMKDRAIPKGNGSESKSPSEAITADSPSQVG